MTAPTLHPFFDYHYYDSLDGSNAEAKRQAEAGAPEGLMVQLGTQLAGRGRRGRDWQSPRGNLYCSFLLRPKENAADAALTSFVAALAVADLADHYLPDGPAAELKWPNDVLLNGAKLSGILLESSAAGLDKLKWLVVGIGINLATVPENVDQAAAAIADYVAAPTPEDARVVLANRLHFWLMQLRQTGFAPIRAAWLARAKGLGAPIIVRLPKETLRGRFSGLDEQGALVLETDQETRLISTGEVFF